MKLINFFPCYYAYYVKRQDFFPNFFENCAFYSRYGTGTCQKSEPECNLSKVGTGTVPVKNSYGSATLSKSV
jgi:hypothetical protein